RGQEFLVSGRRPGSRHRGSYRYPGGDACGRHGPERPFFRGEGHQDFCGGIRETEDQIRLLEQQTDGTPGDHDPGGLAVHRSPPWQVPGAVEHAGHAPGATAQHPCDATGPGAEPEGGERLGIWITLAFHAWAQREKQVANEDVIEFSAASPVAGAKQQTNQQIVNRRFAGRELNPPGAPGDDETERQTWLTSRPLWTN